MKERSIRRKITLWYTMILALILSIVLVGMLVFIHNLETNVAKEELSQNLSAFYGQITFAEDAYYIPADMEFYNNGVVISVYSERGVPLVGSIPSHFPMDTTLKDDTFQRVQGDGTRWLVYDRAYDYGEGKTLWIRGVSTISGVELVAGQIMIATVCLFMGLTAFIGCIGYIMLSKALKPVEIICSEAGEISKGEDLSKRLTIPQIQDEMYRLSISFNEMFDRLEESFEAEKQFSSDVSHELRTPLSVIRSQCEYLIGECRTSDEREEIEIIKNQADRMTNLISQLLTISRCERGSEHFHMEEFDFSFMAEMVVDTLAETAQRNEISIQREIEEGLLVYGEETLLMRMLMNLIENAIFYGKKGGYIKVKIRRKGNYLEGSVEDNGIGISEENLSKIWKRFYREDKSRKNSTNGTGLGLSMVKWIVQIHEGTIDVESQKDEGSTFTFFLPVKSDQMDC